MNIKPLIFDLIPTNDKYFPGKLGAREEVEKNLKKFILQNTFIKRKINQLNNTSTKLVENNSNKLVKKK